MKRIGARAGPGGSAESTGAAEERWKKSMGAPVSEHGTTDEAEAGIMTRRVSGGPNGLDNAQVTV